MKDVIVKVPIKDNCIVKSHDYHSLPSLIREWFQFYFWKNNKERILGAIKQNQNKQLYLEIATKFMYGGIVIEVQLKKVKEK